MKSLVVLMAIMLVFTCQADLLCLTHSQAVNQDGSMEMVVAYTHDIHSHLYPDWTDSGCSGGMSLLASKISELRASNNVLLLDCGDTLSGGAVNDHHNGEPMIRVMNAIGYDAMAIDNHEFDLGVEVLEDMIETAEFDIVSANVEWPGTIQPADYTVVTVDGYEIGIIGLTPSFWYAPDGVTFSSMTSAATTAVQALDGLGVNFIILLGCINSGLAASVPNIDLLVKGSGPEYVADTLCMPSIGSYASQVGMVSLTIDRDTGVIESYSFSVVDLNSPIVPDTTVEAIIDDWNSPLDSELDRPIGYTSSALSRGEMGELLADAIQSSTGVDLAVYNYGGVRDVVPPGFITMRDLYHVEPFFNYIATVDVPGSVASNIMNSNYDSTDIGSFETDTIYTVASSNFSVTYFEMAYGSQATNRQDFVQDSVVGSLADYLSVHMAAESEDILESINSIQSIITNLPETSIISSSRDLITDTLETAEEALNKDDIQATITGVLEARDYVTQMVSCTCAKRWLVTELESIIHILGGSPSAPLAIPWEIIAIMSAMCVIIVVVYYLKIRP